MKKVHVQGPFLTQSGYGHHARTVLRALQTRPDLFDVYVHPTAWGVTSWLWEDDEERKQFDALLEKTIAHVSNKGEFDMSIQVTIPGEWQKLAPINVGITAGIETDKVSAKWIEKSLIMDKILTISKHSVDTFVDTVYEAVNNQTGEKIDFRTNTPIKSITYPVRVFEPKELDLNLSTKFNFLTVSQLSPRKNAKQLISAFIKEFGDNEDVGLIVKANMAKNSLIDRQNTLANFKAVMNQFPDRKCKIYLLHGYLNDNEMAGLYTHPSVKAIVSATHGEGFGLPLFEAAYYGLPVIATNWSGHLDFLQMPVKQKNKKEKLKPMFSRVSYKLDKVQKEAVWEDVILADSQWAYPEEGSIRICLGDLYKDYSRFKKRAKDLQKWVVEEFNEEKQNAEYVEEINSVFPINTCKDFNDVKVDEIPKISLITSVYNASEYIEQLMQDVTEQTIFKEKCEWVFINANPAGNDEEEEVILRYKELYPDNIVYKRLDEDPGVYGVWNEAIKMSTGEFITNVNCDDRRKTTALEEQAKCLMANSDSSLVYCDSYISREANKRFEDITPGMERYNFALFSKENLLRQNLPHNNPMWRRSLHEKHGYFEEKYRSASDWEFWLRCAKAGENFVKHPDILGVYYFNPHGISTNVENFSWKQKEEKEIFLKYRDVVNE